MFSLLSETGGPACVGGAPGAFLTRTYVDPGQALYSTLFVDTPYTMNEGISASTRTVTTNAILLVPFPFIASLVSHSSGVTTVTGSSFSPVFLGNGGGGIQGCESS